MRPPLMDSLDDRILAYPDLSDAERADVERRVLADPERAVLLDEARALHGLLVDARAADDVDVTAIAEYVVARQLDVHPPPPEAAARYARIEAVLEARPDLERQARTFVRALERLSAEAEDPAAQFARLTGRHPVRDTAGTGAAAPARGADRPPVLRRRATRTALVAGLAAGVLYGALAVVGPLLQPERMRLADLAAVSGAYEGLTYRGAAPDPGVDHYAAALERLDDARRSTLGLFPHYDPAALEAIAGELTALIREAPADSWEALEATFLLGRIRLYQGDTGAASAAFRTVVEGDGPSAPDARRLLDWIARQGHAPGA